MTDDLNQPSATDPGLRQMMKWVFITLGVVVVVALVVVEVTLWWFSRS